jgi:predicted dehydrogenase
MSQNTRREFIRNTAVASAAFLAPTLNARVIGANDRVRIGMIGVGSRGQELLKQIVAVPNTEVVAMADIYTRRFDEAKRVVSTIQTFGDHRQLLDRKDIDGVIVASPLHIHAKHFVDTIAAGKDLYAEKTMTWSIPEAEACLASARNSDRVVQIGLQHQSGGALRDARQWLAEGMVGKVTLVDSWMSRNTPHGQGQWVRQPAADCTSANVNWKAFLNGRPNKGFDAYRFINWRLYWMFSGGNVTENMIHQIAWIMSALDLPLPTAGYMSGGIFSEKDGREVPDTIAVTLNFPTETVVSWQSTFSNRRYGLGQKILGSDGTVEYIAGATDMISGESKEQIRYYPEAVNRPHGQAMSGDNPGVNHMANWIDCMRARKTPNAPVDLGYRSAVAAHMANISYRQKRRITLEEAKAFQPEF